jgi:hypothetical protein
MFYSITIGLFVFVVSELKGDCLFRAESVLGWDRLGRDDGTGSLSLFIFWDTPVWKREDGRWKR